MSRGIASLQGYREGGPLSGLASLINRARRVMPTLVGKRSKTGYVPQASEAIYNTIMPWASAGHDASTALSDLGILREASPDPVGLVQKSIQHALPYGSEVPHLLDAVSRIARGEPGRPREGLRLRPPDEEDAWATYLGLPQKGGTFKEAEYRPGKGSGEDIRYLDFANPDRILDEILDDQRMFGTEADQTQPDVIREVVRLLGAPPEEWSSLGAREEEGGPFHRYSDVLGTYTLDKGEDEIGPYISYYDKYDLAHLPARISKVGQPFDVYGRIHYNPETYERMDLGKNRFVEE